jgi:hypothetical protein
MLRAALIGMALSAVAASQARAADALSAFDEYTLRSFAIVQCHAAQSAADRAFLSKADVFRKAAVEQVWARFDAINPQRHNDNGKLTDDTLKRRTAAHERFIQSQVVEYGCDWLDSTMALSPR